MMKMNLNALNEHVVKILIAARPLDSVSAISKRIGLSYGWTHYWVAELLKAGLRFNISKLSTRGLSAQLILPAI